MRILFWVALIVAVYFVVRSKIRGAALKAQREQQAVRERAIEEGEAMASCTHCHVYFPASEAVHVEGHDYCSDAHVRLPPK